MADASYLEAIEGLQPEREKHEFFMTLEPNAGVPMETTRTSDPIKNNSVEDSPLLIGLQYTVAGNLN